MEIKCLWHANKDCNAKFNDLFKPLRVNGLSMHKLINPLWQTPTKRNLRIPYYLRALLGFTQWGMKRGSSEIPIDKWIASQRIYITSANRFHPKEADILFSKIFIPTDEIENKINSITTRYNDYTVGIHIRRTDNVAAISNSPIELYYQYMEMEISMHPETRFYVASDDTTVKQDMVIKYGDRIIVGDWELNRTTTNGMKDAVAELYCLARTKKIIGSSNSTYTLVASKMYNTPLVIVRG